jgi:ABC-type cobalt transport system substrate-binding protein
MKSELLALALLIAFVGFMNVHMGPDAGERTTQSIAFLANGAYPSWIDLSWIDLPWTALPEDPLWKPAPGAQALLFGLQVAGCITAVYFLRRRKKSSEREWD